MPWDKEQRRKYMKKYNVGYKALRGNKKILDLEIKKKERIAERKKLQEHVKTIFTGGSDNFGHIVENEGLLI